MNVITGASIARQAACASGIATPIPGERDGRLDERVPRQPPEAPRQLAQPCRHARDGTRGRPDRVVDELLPERHLELDELRRARLRAETGDRDEEVEDGRLAARRVPHEREAAAEQARHHRLRDARGEARGHRGIDRGPARGKHVEADARRRRMARSHPCRGPIPPHLRRFAVQRVLP